MKILAKMGMKRDDQINEMQLQINFFKYQLQQYGNDKDLLADLNQLIIELNKLKRPGRIDSILKL